MGPPLSPFFPFARVLKTHHSTVAEPPWLHRGRWSEPRQDRIRICARSMK
ncbi:hypothetical protein ES332_A08G121300v1 [Gossypium tomentosum]|uniref:Uncharacterized protein n=1 Tax=Gossypium tomentosum TaxID=34277 RepID=A0A5D2PEW1_GOSTO|nr:hypothetical protein ES332_A08G121300v1 [Gossypium tomentosum]